MAGIGATMDRRPRHRDVSILIAAGTDVGSVLRLPAAREGLELENVASGIHESSGPAQVTACEIGDQAGQQIMRNATNDTAPAGIRLRTGTYEMAAKAAMPTAHQPKFVRKDRIIGGATNN
jgi:hypothetical protein